MYSILPGHCCVLQKRETEDDPGQPIPLRHVRLAFCRPPPHDTEQTPYIHSLQLPSALYEKVTKCYELFLPFQMLFTKTLALNVMIYFLPARSFNASPSIGWLMSASNIKHIMKHLIFSIANISLDQ